MRIEQAIAKAEKLDIDWHSNTIRARYQDGSEETFVDVRVHFPSLVAALLRTGALTPEQAQRVLAS